MMKRIKLIDTNAPHYEYLHDCQRIVAALRTVGLIATVEEAYTMWHEFSQSMAAGWLRLPRDNDDEIISSIQRYFEEGDEEEE